ncbi:MAG: DUF192 domain-containing protein [Anaerolineales bacterium]|nr:DUF192 domain-containing protein [Anaerolineales bacterium]MCS7246876.1 DUF192 domain-containing protein [Anaerolineales bacterium]MDW8160687.1 DUF192 domain-containing protein [Anaerolineales bacterium]MDW8448159.1 DUF192 domain-containing protein [Anaerolineales bacterium]
MWVKLGRNRQPLDPPLSLRVCRSFVMRLRGYLFSAPPTFEQGLLFWYLRPGRWNTAIHMIGVPFPLAVIWLNEAQLIVDKRMALPWQVALVPKRAAQYVIECHPQRLIDFSEGEKLDFLEEVDG